jgi:Lon protease-like protein
VSPLELPLFPLSTVLFPGGTLGLRIFERRYLDMIASCSKGGTGFGVCLIRSGREAGEPAVPAAVGTLARIADFTLLDDGLLGITALGETAFRTQRTEVRDNGLLVGQVELRAEDPLLPVPPEFSLLATLLERLAGQLGGELKRAPNAASTTRAGSATASPNCCRWNSTSASKCSMKSIRARAWACWRSGCRASSARASGLRHGAAGVPRLAAPR